jgi:hypothetical protein
MNISEAAAGAPMPTITSPENPSRASSLRHWCSRAQQGLGLLALLLGTAEWGVAGAGLPDDPAKKNWESDTGEDSGKHVMSYAVGGVGILHADVGDLEEYVKWVAARSGAGGPEAGTAAPD